MLHREGVLIIGFNCYPTFSFFLSCPSDFGCLKKIKTWLKEKDGRKLNKEETKE